MHMQWPGESRVRGNHRGTLAAAAVLLLLAWAPAGCTSASKSILPADLHSRVASATGTAEDHLAAAQICQHHADRLLYEAEHFQQQAVTLTDQQDPTGAQRERLTSAAQDRRAKADEMQKLYAEHFAKAAAMTARP